jgi:hypothetical protein
MMPPFAGLEARPIGWAGHAEFSRGASTAMSFGDEELH